VPRIRILPDILANKIAAGEVVERPASVVKELVENALDAGSSRVIIEIEKGGRSLIRVADNGFGMAPDDALMALERFATSKIRTDTDLFAIQTLGFRGEALPSIAAVSKMTLVTRSEDADSGVRVAIEGGKIVTVTETGAPRGTMISVAQLFFNTPARRKFLKTISTEMGHIADTVAGMALGHPQVHFKLTHDSRIVKQWPGVSQPGERVADVLGHVNPGDLITLEGDDGYLNLSGCLGPSRVIRNTTRGIYLYVNGRRVRDRIVQHALLEGYSGRLMKGQFPVAVLFLALPYDQVDVNVHPTKHEIRFADSRRVHAAVRDGVAAALKENERRLWRVEKNTREPGDMAIVAQPHVPYGPKVETPVPKGNHRYAPMFFERPDSQPLPVTEPSLVSSPAEKHTEIQRPLQPDTTPAAPPSQTELWSQGRFSDLTVIGQFRGTYILCQDGDDLILIDQHAAHERIVYERLGSRTGSVESQRLLMPETVDLGFAEAEALNRLIPRFSEMGLEIEPFGGTTFVVKAVPVMLDDRAIEHVVRDLAEKAVQTGLESNLDKVLDACRMVMACHNAVRAKQHLAPPQITRMLAELDQCDNPSHCPHGRPTWIRYTLRDLEKAFGRITR
jgi:DNA mismatch repair protein MutL